MKKDAKDIIKKTIEDVMPGPAVLRKLSEIQFSGRVFVVAVGKAAWTMTKAATEYLGEKIYKGIIVTKYNHARGALPNFEIVEAGHPIPDEHSILGARHAVELLKEAGENDSVLFLLSGGGSALFELPAEGISLEDIQTVTGQLLASGASIQEINVIRKKLSEVKGGKLAGYARKAACYSIILSDVLGNHDDMIASGLTYPDTATAKEVAEIISRYNIKLSGHIKQVLKTALPCKEICVENHVVGSVRLLCEAAATHARELGYQVELLTDSMTLEAREAGRWISSMAKKKHEVPTAYIAGGETVVTVKGKGLGGRNQEIAISAAIELAGIPNVLLFSLGSDGTDGPTDAAGGMADGDTCRQLWDLGIDLRQVLKENDAYHALEKVDGLLMTGPTGTNVNDVTVLLIRPKQGGEE